MWEKILAELKALFSGQRAEIKADMAEAVKAASTAQAESGKLTEQLSAATTENTRLNGSLTEANETIKTLRAESAAVLSQVNAACKALNVAEGDETKIAAMSLGDKITALQNGASVAIAKTGVDVTALPGGKAPEKTGDGKTMTQAAFNALSFAERNSFIRAGGKLKD
jgi:hypothetical protein